jgi:hypothetical protein
VDHKEAVLLLANSLQNYFIENYPNEVTVDTYRIELSRLENDQRFKERVAIYDGGDTVASSIPGTNIRGQRVDTGWATDTIQVYNFQISWRIAQDTEDGWYNEIDLINLKDHVHKWVNVQGQTIVADSDCYYTALIWGGSTPSQRIKNFATTTATVYTRRGTPKP